MKKHIPIRMCIVCKNRFRFKVVLGDIVPKAEHGRSGYLCQNCIEREDKVLQKAFSKICKNLNTKITQQGLKEIFLNGKD